MGQSSIRSLRKLDQTSFGVSLPKQILCDELGIPDDHEGIHVIVDEVEDTDAKLEFNIKIVTAGDIV